MKKNLHKLMRYAGYILFRPIWWLERLIPRNKNIWIFGAWYGQKYSDNSKWLYEYVLENEREIKAVWITKNCEVYKKLRSQNKPVYMSASFAGAWWCLRAKYALLTSGVVDVNAFALNGCKQIWLWHGMPLKKILNSETSYLSLSKINKIVQKVLNPYFSFKPYSTLTSADFFTPFLKEAFQLPESRIWKTGLPRCDAFFTSLRESCVDKFRTQFAGARIFLYMPTFRMSSAMDGTPFNPFISTFGFDEKEFGCFLETQNIVFLFKPHFVDSVVHVEVSSQRFRCISDNDFGDLYLLLNSVDVLLTDYSSVYFDFIPTIKTIYLLPFDYEDYKKTSRDHYFNMYEKMKAVVCNSWSDFYDNVKNHEWKKIDFGENKIFAEYLDGTSSKKIVDTIKK